MSLPKIARGSSSFPLQSDRRRATPTQSPEANRRGAFRSPLRRVRVLSAAAHRKPDRHAEQPERLTQSVGEEALVALGDAVDVVAEKHEERRGGRGVGGGGG